MPTLSALVVARNEAARLPDCLASLWFADEIVVVLDRTTDASGEIARAAGARVVFGIWPVQGDRRNAGIAACASDWVLEVDADERVPLELATELRATVARSDDDWHLIPVDNWVGNRAVRHGWAESIGKSAYAGLFRQGAKEWGTHGSQPRIRLAGRQGPPLQHRLTHRVDGNISDLLARFDRYTSNRARDLLESGGGESLGRQLLRMPYRFWKSYVGQGGWREGGLGLLVAMLASAYPFVAWIKAREALGWPQRAPMLRWALPPAVAVSAASVVLLIAPGTFQSSTAAPKLCAAMVLADRNRDGVVDANEYREYRQARESLRLQAAGASEATVEKAVQRLDVAAQESFDRLDVDHNGQLSGLEWDTHVPCPSVTVAARD